MRPLKKSKAGEKVCIQCLGCSCNEACRLREMGCVEGHRGTIISNQSNVVLQVGESRLAINGDLARTIFVSPN